MVNIHTRTNPYPVPHTNSHPTRLFARTSRCGPQCMSNVIDHHYNSNPTWLVSTQSCLSILLTHAALWANFLCSSGVITGANDGFDAMVRPKQFTRERRTRANLCAGDYVHRCARMRARMRKHATHYNVFSLFSVHNTFTVQPSKARTLAIFLDSHSICAHIMDDAFLPLTFTCVHT